jgi:DNA-binding protein H-NS
MSNTSLADLNAQIKELETQRAQLQAEAEKQRKEAMSFVIQELIETVATYGLTASELGLRVGKAEKAKPARKSLGAKIAQSGKTHKGPNGQTWTEGARGRKPHWVDEELSKTASSTDSAER